MDPTKVYQHSNPGRLIFGPGAINELKREFSTQDRPFLITDKGIVRTGILKTVTDVLAEAGVPYELFDRVEEDPSIEVVEESAGIYRESGCTSIIGLGGGSAMDVAKAVAVVGAGGGDLREHMGGTPVAGPLPLLCAIPTTAGTGSEVTSVAIIADRERKVKAVVKGPALVPRIAVLDPLLLASVPPRLAAQTGADALTHAIESYFVSTGQAITDALSLSAIRIIMANLPSFVTNARDVAAAGQMLLASCMAGMSFKNTGLALVHSLSHPAGAYFHVAHGLACALYLPVVMEFNAPVCASRLASVADAAGVDIRGLSVERAAAESVRAVRDLLANVGLPRTFSDMGIDFELQPNMVDDAFGMTGTKNNPRAVDRNQLAALFMSVR